MSMGRGRRARRECIRQRRAVPGVDQRTDAPGEVRLVRVRDDAGVGAEAGSAACSGARGGGRGIGRRVGSGVGIIAEGASRAPPDAAG
jgi:hypothetical protein